MSITTEDTTVNRRGILFDIQGTVGSVGFALATLLGGYISIKYSTSAVLIFISIFLTLLAIVGLSTMKKVEYKVK